jgi:hypothetical protein
MNIEWIRVPWIVVYMVVKSPILLICMLDISFMKANAILFVLYCCYYIASVFLFIRLLYTDYHPFVNEKYGNFQLSWHFYRKYLKEVEKIRNK